MQSNLGVRTRREQHLLWHCVCCFLTSFTATTSSGMQPYHRVVSRNYHSSARPVSEPLHKVHAMHPHPSIPAAAACCCLAVLAAVLLLLWLCGAARSRDTTTKHPVRKVNITEKLLYLTQYFFMTGRATTVACGHGPYSTTQSGDSGHHQSLRANITSFWFINFSNIGGLV